MRARRLPPQYKVDILKIISGGQTGVDRAALDVALKYRIKCGGWCPDGRLDESGKIPDRYPLKELKHGGNEERTLRNVHDSDGTVVIYFHELEGGTGYTVGCCEIFTGRRCDADGFIRVRPRRRNAQFGRSARERVGRWLRLRVSGGGCFCQQTKSELETKSLNYS